MATLIIAEGPARGERFALAEHRIVLIGRDADCTFQILDEQMSRRHMQIKRQPDSGDHLAVDFQSKNGVRVNGTKINEPAPLRDGDEIRIGTSVIVYSTMDSPDAKSIDGLLRKRGEGLKETINPEPSRGGE